MKQLKGGQNSKRLTKSINTEITSTLPVCMDDAVIYMDSAVLVVKSENDFVLNRNLRFDICWFDVGGWYSGQTAGLLETVNNGHFYQTDRLLRKTVPLPSHGL